MHKKQLDANYVMRCSLSIRKQAKKDPAAHRAVFLQENSTPPRLRLGRKEMVTREYSSCPVERGHSEP
jgi:hypothetical protein